MISHHLRRSVDQKPAPVVASFVDQGADTAPGATYSVPVPSGTTAGDLLLMYFWYKGDNGFDLQSSGWSIGYGYYFKYAGAGEVSYDFSSLNTGSTGTYRVVILRVTGGTLTVGGAEVGPSGTSFSVPAITPSAANSLVICRAIDRVNYAGFDIPGFTSITNGAERRFSWKVFSANTGTVLVNASSGTDNYGQLIGIAPA